MGWGRGTRSGLGLTNVLWVSGGRGRLWGLWLGLITTRFFIELWRLLPTGITEIGIAQLCSQAGVAVILQKPAVVVRVGDACYEGPEQDLFLRWNLKVLVRFLCGFRVDPMLPPCHWQATLGASGQVILAFLSPEFDAVEVESMRASV